VSLPPFVSAMALGALAQLPLLVGAWIALRLHPSDRTVGRVAAFGAGALLSAVAFELVLDAVDSAPALLLACALAAGAVVYYFGDRALSKGGQSQDRATRGRALMLGATLDGIPESFILGLSLVAGAGVSVAFFVAVVVSNFPEGMASASELDGDGTSPAGPILLMWLGVMAASAVAAGLGASFGGLTTYSGAVAQAFAAGALLTMLTDDLVPEAREEAGVGAGLMAVFGFAVAFGLHQMGA
jgi:zinc transporter, ZIP family